jgi:DNA polymerase III epsilon subunit-like protein
VAERPSWTEIEQGVRCALKNVWLVAHNARVEYEILSRHLPGWSPIGVIDTLRLARFVWPALEGYSLELLVGRLGLGQGEYGTTRHRASSDAYCTALLAHRLLRSNKFASWDDIRRVACPAGLPGSFTQLPIQKGLI